MNKRLLLLFGGMLFSTWICSGMEKESRYEPTSDKQLSDCNSVTIHNDFQLPIVEGSNATETKQNNRNFFALYKGLQPSIVESMDINKRLQDVQIDEFYSPDNSDSEEELVIKYSCDNKYEKQFKNLNFLSSFKNLQQSELLSIDTFFKHVASSLLDSAKAPFPDVQVMKQELATIKQWIAQSKGADYACYLSSCVLAEKYFKMHNVSYDAWSDSNNMIMKLIKLIACEVIFLESKKDLPRIVINRRDRIFCMESYEFETSDFSVLNKMIEQFVGINCHITTIPGVITVLKNLQKINIYCAKSISPRVCELLQLTHLTIEQSPQEISPIKDYLTQCTGLKCLVLPGNRLTDIPSGISALTNLTWLYLYKNKLTYIPINKVSALTNLTILDLSDNELTNIPPEISVLTNLTKFDVCFNDIKVLPESMEGMTKLNLNLHYGMSHTCPVEELQKLLRVFKHPALFSGT